MNDNDLPGYELGSYQKTRENEQQMQFGTSLEFKQVTNDQVIISPTKPHKQGWKF